MGRDPHEKHIFGPSTAPLDDLLALKHSRELSISVCLPALNEGATIGDICSLIRQELVERIPLVDEIVVIDSDSSDATAELATRAGATVHNARDLMSNVGDVRGKGDALWRSLAVVQGDIVVWLDSDTRNMHTGFVTDLIAPLLTDEGYVFSKAFYERPIVDDEGLLTTGGARVTEIAVRPLLQLFYPELTHVVQPLSGEYAGYRSVLGSIPFSTGYGVDIGLLIDIADRYGVETIAQVDLGRRIHRNRPTLQLGRMSFQVMQAMFTRLDDIGRLKLAEELPHVLTQYHSDRDGPRREDYDLEVVTRPPMRSRQTR